MWDCADFWEDGYQDARSFTPPVHSPARLEVTHLDDSEPESDPATAWHPKRRKRQEEIADSYDSSPFATVSPNRQYRGDETPKREAKRIKGC